MMESGQSAATRGICLLAAALAIVLSGCFYARPASCVVKVAEVENPRTAEGKRACMVLLGVLSEGGGETSSYLVNFGNGVVTIQCKQTKRAQELIRDAIAREHLQVIIFNRVSVALIRHAAWAEGRRARAVLQGVLTQELGGSFIGISSRGWVIVDHDQVVRARELIRDAIAREHLQVKVFE